VGEVLFKRDGETNARRSAALDATGAGSSGDRVRIHAGRGTPARLRRYIDPARRYLPRVDGRRRQHLALFAALSIVSAIALLFAQPRTVHVLADGERLEIRTVHSGDIAVVRAAGISIGPGDRVTALRGASSDVLRVDRPHRVALTIDGRRYESVTHAETIDQLLREADVSLVGRDSVWQDGSPVSTGARLAPRAPLAGPAAVPAGFARDAVPIDIEVRRAMPVTLVEQGREIPTTTSRATVAQALREAGIIVGPNDRVSPPLDAPVEDDATIEVRHAIAVTLTLPDEERVVYTFQRTVADVLSESGVALPEGTYVDPPIETAVDGDLRVRVVQLSASREIEREFIKSRTIYRTDESLGPGQTRTEGGADGSLVRRYDVQYANGVEAGRDLIEEYYDPEPADTVVYYPPQTGLGQNGPAEGEVARVLNVYATYYTPASAGRSPNDPAYGRTATGVLVTYGVVAVDPNVIPLGTRMFIPGYGYAVAADTGGAVKGYIIDLGYPDGVAVDWRSRWLDIYILS
jgi:uncharacterized protein YabE (DUF348 family)/3D (Asp-Asp-Asp) domain-containing protein